MGIDKKDEVYWDRVREWAKHSGAGCTAVPDFYKECCWEHDHAYRTGRTIEGAPISRKEADKWLRDCIQNRSKLGKFSPMSWWRWTGVRMFGRWKKYGAKI
jgi:hypothetical protein